MYTLYWAPDNANLAVRIALEEIGAAYTDVLVDRSKHAHHTPEYIKLNPQGLLPVLIDPAQDEPLFETGAILLHLADTHQALMPGGSAGRGKCLKWLFYLSNTLHADLRGMFYSERYVSAVEAVPQLRQGLRERIKGHLQLLDREIAASGGPWLLGQTLTICDIYLTVCTRWAVLYPANNAIAIGSVAALPNLSRMLGLFEQRAAVRASLEKENLATASHREFSAPTL